MPGIFLWYTQSMEIFDAILFIGPQGSGKGTQATILHQAIGAEYIEAGHLLRDTAKLDSDFGRHIKSLIESGTLVSDKELISVLGHRLENLNPDIPVIFDGVPRQMKQAEILMNFLRQTGRKRIATIYISIPRPLTVERLQLRLICKLCEHPERKNGNPDQACTVCGGPLMHRADDQTEAINRRLNLFEKETLPVVAYLQRETKFFHVDGSGTIPAVTAQIFNDLRITAADQEHGHAA